MNTGNGRILFGLVTEQGFSVYENNFFEWET